MNLVGHEPFTLYGPSPGDSVGLSPGRRGCVSPAIHWKEGVELSAPHTYPGFLGHQEMLGDIQSPTLCSEALQNVLCC